MSKKRAEGVLGLSIVDAHATKPGYAHNLHWRVSLSDGSTAFIKESVDEATAYWLEKERHVYQDIRPACAPEFLGWVPADDEHHALLIIEDLSNCEWPPPWTSAQVDAVVEAVQELGPASVDPLLGSMRETISTAPSWADVRTRMPAFDALKVTTPDWIRRNIGVLEAAADFSLLDGEDFVHLDLRSDNLCFRPDGRVVVVDWNWAGRGNRWADLAFWLVTVALEGGPLPAIWEQIDPRLWAIVAGYMAGNASDVPLPHVPKVRAFQRAQLEVVLPWAARGLGLEVPELP
jgi:hypothetical protein